MRGTWMLAAVAAAGTLRRSDVSQPWGGPLGPYVNKHAAGVPQEPAQQALQAAEAAKAAAAAAAEAARTANDAALDADRGLLGGGGAGPNNGVAAWGHANNGGQGGGAGNNGGNGAGGNMPPANNAYRLDRPPQDPFEKARLWGSKAVASVEQAMQAAQDAADAAKLTMEGKNGIKPWDELDQIGRAAIAAGERAQALAKQAKPLEKFD
mmetsp:Transcript_54309/g.119071  ORF Transcript_54309/g.119071 Transcript_54309/m.119071 type:complete len:209 (+) Transcript_54309:122-748(+)|eukprot:CAMPEP_0204345276 /NCGR_PEP_ID=MMETSP0469-20131031/26258_1 /ASSEMBLY_ACC=CAM_ASM_000384 /TAXON_ID=2969 /ORGANISM="Oxyrrhis marina" /LENGTH=208 /DNA_ID=CAMNT_0051330683 /DNA_START=122 /DNA_END=748 /DNA_ORIENTATION=-